MPRSFPAFMGTFPRLTPIQARAFPVLLEGKHAVIGAPAASGKTEAALTPLCERAMDRMPGSGVAILYIVPTRALANDIEVRCKGPASALGLDLVVRTGDRPSPVGKGQIGILVTTPESFDSLLCRVPHAFDQLSAVVVDEAHLMDGTYRGDQLRILFRRLPCAPQMVAMSATIGDAMGLGQRLFGRDCELVLLTDARPIVCEDAENPLDALRLLRAEGLSKAICFCNTRAKVEETCAQFALRGPWPPDRVMAHHGSMGRREREEVERAFRRWESAILVCTNTMELGIDVGDVDAVVLIGAPRDFASFLQRVGRGCRRKAGMLAVCVSEHEGDRGAFAGFRRALLSREEGPQPYTPDISVAVQQVFSMLFARPAGMARGDLLRILAPLGSKEDLIAILDHLLSLGHIEAGGQDVLRASTGLMDMGERGTIHSNIPDEKELEVVDSTTSRLIGKVLGIAKDGYVTLAGRTWRILGMRRGKLYATPVPGDAAPPRFQGRAQVGAFYAYLPPALRRGGTLD